jgi:hypothetical protein
MNNEFRARARAILGAPLTIDTPTGDDFDIQWMPPGPQSPVCFVGDDAKELSFTVLPQHAEMFDAMLQKMLSDAAAGNGDVPFIDFNHEDGAASGRPTKFYWGGDDPQTGGIRLKGKWTGSGKAAVQGKDFTRFSPEWFFGANNEPLAIGANLGGLVNRAAFKSIAAVAKSALTDFDNSLEGRVARAIAVAVAPLQRRAEALSKTYKQLAGPAAPRMQEDTPAAILARASVPRIGKILNPLPLEDHPFMEQAKALAASNEISEADAQVQIARANYPLYKQYCASLQQVTLTRAAGKVVHNGQEGLLTLVQAKQAAGMTFDDAVNFVSRTRPDLVEAYRGSFLSKAH